MSTAIAPRTADCVCWRWKIVAGRTWRSGRAAIPITWSRQDHRAIKQWCAPMLGLKSFRSAAITLAGVELAHRVRKQQYSLPKGMKGRAGSLRELWAAALADSGAPMLRDGDRPASVHQNSADRFQPARARPDGSVRYPPKISFGGNLYLLVRPQGGRYWHYHYRYSGKRKTLSLGTYPGRKCSLMVTQILVS